MNESEPLVTVPPDLAALFAHPGADGRGWLRRVIDAEFRRNGGRTPVLLARWLDAVESAQRLARVSGGGQDPFRPSETLTVTEFAALAGVSPQAVRARCRRGTLPAQMVDGAWRIRIERTAA